MKKQEKKFDLDENVGKCEIYLCFSRKGLPNPENLLCGSTLCSPVQTIDFAVKSWFSKLGTPPIAPDRFRGVGMGTAGLGESFSDRLLSLLHLKAGFGSEIGPGGCTGVKYTL